MKPRLSLAVLALSAAGLTGIALHEGYVGTAARPLPGDVPTIGFGSTTHADGSPVRMGDTTTPPAALARAAADIQRFESAIKACVQVPLYPHEYDAFVSLSYNIGPTAFCRSTLVKKLNASDYAGACAEIVRWRFFQGKDCALPGNKCSGLYQRRLDEQRRCLGNVP